MFRLKFASTFTAFKCFNFIVSQMFFFHMGSENLKLVAAFVVLVLVADFVVVVMWMVADFVLLVIKVVDIAVMMLV